MGKMDRYIMDPEDKALFLRLIDPRSTHEDVLGVTAANTDEEIARAYRELSRRVHPDRLTETHVQELEYAEIKKESLMIRVRKAYEGIRRVDLVDCRVTEWYCNAQKWSQWTAPYQLYGSGADNDVIGPLRVDNAPRTLCWDSLRPKFTVLSFWSPDCPPCVVFSNPMLNAMHTHLGIPVIGVAAWSGDGVREYLEEHPLDYPVCQLDESDLVRISADLGIKSVPTCCIVHKGRSVWCGHTSKVLEKLMQFGAPITKEDVTKMSKVSFGVYIDQLEESARKKYVIDRDYVNRALNSYTAGYITAEAFKGILNGYKDMPYSLYKNLSFDLRSVNKELADDFETLYMAKDKECMSEFLGSVQEMQRELPGDRALYCLVVCCFRIAMCCAPVSNWCSRTCCCAGCRPRPLNYTEEYMVLDGQKMV